MKIKSPLVIICISLCATAFAQSIQYYSKHLKEAKHVNAQCEAGTLDDRSCDNVAKALAYAKDRQQSQALMSGFAHPRF